MRSVAHNEPKASSHWLAPFILMLLALLSTTIGVWLFLGMWQRLPLNLPWKSLNAECEQVENDLRSNTALHGAIRVRTAGLMLMGYLQRDASAGDIQGQLLRVYGGTSPSEISRIHMAAARMLTLERTGQPIETWWPSLKPLLEGIASSPMPTLERDYTVALADGTHAKAAIGAGTAFERAEHWNAQTAVLQYIGPKIRAIVDERRAANDGQGATIARLALIQCMRSLLALQEPVCTRLLAADVLADFLAGEPKDIRPKEVIAALRAWRSSVTKAARARQSTMFGVSGGPDMVHPLQEHLANAIARSAGLAVTSLLLGAVTLVLAWPLLAGGISAIRYRGVAYAGVGLALAAIVAVMVVQGTMTDRVFEDVRRAGHEPWTTLVTPKVVGAIALALAAIVSAIPLGGAHHVSKLARAGAICGIAWLCTSFWLIGSSIMAERARQTYETELGRALRSDVAALLAGSDVDKKLDPVRSWQP